jgi:hypothetical protein
VIIFRLKQAVVYLALPPMKWKDRPFVWAATPDSTVAFMQRDNKNKIVWYEKCWSNGLPYQALK